VAENLTKAELNTHITELGDMLAEWSVEFEVPVRDKDHRHSCGERLADRPDGEGRVLANEAACSVLGLTDLDRHRLATVINGELGPGNLMRSRQFRKRVLQVPRVYNSTVCGTVCTFHV
jgi:hypothetical protein